MPFNATIFFLGFSFLIEILRPNCIFASLVKSWTLIYQGLWAVFIIGGTLETSVGLQIFSTLDDNMQRFWLAVLSLLIMYFVLILTYVNAAISYKHVMLDVDENIDEKRRLLSWAVKV